ncbi:MAG: hypothetical protein EZS28_012935 [Streblomastix strix]|uniref:USP domain-containing protein n=1 Tax=Streblomastix strix TaxID=222440 RepID=A0A5J4WAI7_9EUKA|nr:MAG: hypothetical protein EZS28_012935 [Streblomastix strix]
MYEGKFLDIAAMNNSKYEKHKEKESLKDIEKEQEPELMFKELERENESINLAQLIRREKIETIFICWLDFGLQKDFDALKNQKNIKDPIIDLNVFGCLDVKNNLHKSPFSSKSGSSDNQSVDIISCLDQFTTREQLNEQNLYYCSKCKKMQRAYKKMDVMKFPNILIIHLKRFAFTLFRREKLTVDVKFPIQGLDLSSFEQEGVIQLNRNKQDNKKKRSVSPLDSSHKSKSRTNSPPGYPPRKHSSQPHKHHSSHHRSQSHSKSPSNISTSLIPGIQSIKINKNSSSPVPSAPLLISKQQQLSPPKPPTPSDIRLNKEKDQNTTDNNGDPIYDLYGIVNHSGTLTGGHYTSVTYNPFSHKWYNISDSTVSEVKPSSVTQKGAESVEPQQEIQSKQSGIVPPPSSIQSPNAYLLFYARRGFNNWSPQQIIDARNAGITRWDEIKKEQKETNIKSEEANNQDEEKNDKQNEQEQKLLCEIRCLDGVKVENPYQLSSQKSKEEKVGDSLVVSVSKLLQANQAQKPADNKSSFLVAGSPS